MTAGKEQYSQYLFAHPELLGLTARQTRTILPEVISFLEEHPCVIGETLFGRSGPWKIGNVRYLESLVTANHKGRRGRDMLRVLRKVARVFSLQQRKFVPLPRIPIAPRKDKNPFKGNLFRNLSRYADWQMTLNSWVNSSPEQDRLLDCLVVSSVLYGGLLSRAALAALIRAVGEKALRTVIVDGRVHVELGLSWRGRFNAEMRRWQPDLLSAALWARVSPATVGSLLEPVVDDEGRSRLPTDRESFERLALRLEMAVSDDGSARGRKAKRLGALMHAARVTAYSDIPAILVRYASREIVSHSMSRAALKRLSLRWTANANPVPVTKSIESATETVRRAAPSEDQDELERELVAAFAPKERKQIRQTLQKMAADPVLPGFARRMADFADSLLGSTGPSGKVSSISSARNTAISIVRSIGNALNGNDPAELEAVSLEELYLQALEGSYIPEAGATNRSAALARLKSDLARALFEFHFYLMARFQISPIEDEVILQYIDRLAGVEANPLTLEDYLAVLAEVNRRWPRSERRTIVRLLIILGFRCGLRRREALRLRIKDVFGGSLAELRIRPSGLLKLKSANAKRRIPLFAFLTENELREFETWIQTRVGQEAAPEDFVFGSPREGLEILPESIFEEINDVLRTATGGDRTMHYHQLRHAFCTWTLTRLMLADLQPMPVMFPHLPDTSRWLAESPAFRAQLYGHTAHTRKHAYLVARLLGHGSPGTSLAHYMHMMDWLLAVHLDRSVLLRTEQEDLEALVRVASGRARSTLDRWIKEGGLGAIPIQVWQSQADVCLPKTIEHAPSGEQAELANGTDEPSSADWITLSWKFLDEYGRHKLSLEETCFRHKLDPASAQGMLDRARYLATLPDNSGSRRRHRMQLWVPDKRYPDLVETLDCPRRPQARADWQVVRRFAEPLRMLAEADKSYLQHAVDLFVRRIGDDGFLRFDNIQCATEAQQYRDFLLRLGVDIQHFRFVSGDPRARSPHRATWRECLKVDSKVKIERSNGHFGPPTALSIRPEFGPEMPNRGGHFGFRFALVMAFVVFGRLQSVQAGCSRDLQELRP